MAMVRFCFLEARTTSTGRSKLVSPVFLGDRAGILNLMEYVATLCVLIRYNLFMCTWNDPRFRECDRLATNSNVHSNLSQ